MKNLFILIVVALFLGACSSSKQDEDILNTSTFFYNEIEKIAHLDPLLVENDAERRLVHQLYNGLWQLENDGTIYPVLADSTQQIDSLTWKFVLKKDIFLHSTAQKEVLTAKDVVESLQKWLHSDLDDSATQIFKELIGSEIETAFEVIDERRFVIHLQAPFSPFLHLLTTTPALIVPEKSSRFGNRFSPVGSGAFYVSYYEGNEVLILKKNPLYFRRTTKLDTLPLLDEIHVSFIENDEKAASLMSENRLDWIADSQQAKRIHALHTKISTSTKAQLFQLDSFPILKTTGFEVVLADTSRSNPLLIQSFRQALNMGLDRSKFHKSPNFAKPAYEGIFPTILPRSYQERINGYVFRPTVAKDILQKIGYDSTFVLKIYALAKDTAWVNLARKQWKNIGVDSELSTKANAHLLARSFISPFADASSLFWQYKSLDSLINSYYSFKKLGYDSLVKASFYQTDDYIREQNYTTLSKQIIRNAPFLEIYYHQYHQLSATTLNGLAPTPIGVYHFDQLDKTILRPTSLKREDYMYE